jgi:hypothetical protein
MHNHRPGTTQALTTPPSRDKHIQPYYKVPEWDRILSTVPQTLKGTIQTPQPSNHNLAHYHPIPDFAHHWLTQPCPQPSGRKDLIGWGQIRMTQTLSSSGAGGCVLRLLGPQMQTASCDMEQGARAAALPSPSYTLWL